MKTMIKIIMITLVLATTTTGCSTIHEGMNKANDIQNRAFRIDYELDHIRGEIRRCC
jgi:predicted small secreted protein